jgi:hydrogenase-4 transcriptional activator
LKFELILQPKELINLYLQMIREFCQTKNAVLYLPALTEHRNSEILIELNPEFAIYPLSTPQDAHQFIQEQENLRSERNTTNELFVNVTPKNDNYFKIFRIDLNKAAEISLKPSGDLQLKTNPIKITNYCWLGLRYENNEQLNGFSENHLPTSLYQMLLAFAGSLSTYCQQCQSSLLDPLTQLFTRNELKIQIAKLQQKKQNFVVILINPNDFKQVNKQCGRKAGDSILIEIANRLKISFAEHTLISRYGAAHFAVVLPVFATEKNDDLAQCQKYTEQLAVNLSQASFLNNTYSIAFNFGLSLNLNTISTDITLQTLLLRAEQALDVAKLKGQNISVIWHKALVSQFKEKVDKLQGIFTASESKDYRNMLLLWDVMSMVSVATEQKVLATQFVERLLATFALKNIYLFLDASNDNPALIIGRQAQNQSKINLLPTHSITAPQLALVDKCRSKRSNVEIIFDETNQSSPLFAHAFPFIAQDSYIGCLYVDGSEDSLLINIGEVLLLDALTNQLSAAFDRLFLQATLKRNQELEQLRLQQELKELRSAIQFSNLVYCSVQMEELVNKIQKVAITDATVLIAGETGTGKELLTHTLHKLSSRADKPFVVIDCGAIPDALIESELFGHVKGAFTGAGQRNSGRIIDAIGGTLVLDEIGEIPLDVQSKLLRFVQEKQITPIGGGNTQVLDVRIVAATNRNLAKEVSAGRFRADLYYRLNAVEIHAPPLRERSQDILYLIKHFMTKFSAQYHKEKLQLSPSAATAALSYHWPGNVRELQHKVMQAVIFSEGNIISPHNLALDVDGINPPQTHHNYVNTVVDENRDASHTKVSDQEGNIMTEQLSDTTSIHTLWQQLEQQLSQQISAVVEKAPIVPIPLGSWLNDDLILIAYQVSNHISRQAASLLSIPESTFRRKLQKAENKKQAGLAPRPKNWSELTYLLTQLIKLDIDMIKKSQIQLLSQIKLRIPDNVSLTAQLMAISEPTLRKLVSS